MNEPQEVQIGLSGETAKGVYTNFAVITHTPNEFVFDFAVMLPNQPAIVASRVLTSPRHAKSLLRALEENIRKYEAVFGEITDLELPRDAGSRTPTN